MRKWLLLVLLILVTLFSACTSVSASTPTFSAQEQKAHDIFVAASEYLHKYKLIDEQTDTKIDETIKILKLGNVTTRQWSQIINDLLFDEATLISQLDNDPKYFILHRIMWETGMPPKLIRPTDNLTYIFDYETQHLEGLKKVNDFLKSIEIEYAHVFQYTPTWLDESLVSK